MKGCVATYCTVLLATLITTCSGMQLFDNPHFFRAQHFFGEPRLAKKGLSSYDIGIATGGTSHSYNGAGQTTTLLNIYGPSNMLALGTNVPGKSINNAADLALINVSNLPYRDCFGQLLFTGKLHAVDTLIIGAQNLVHGFFLQALIPLRKLEISCIERVDLSPKDSICPNSTSATWQAFLNSFDAILQRYNLCLSAVDNKGIGDVTALFGWAHNYHDTQVLDYVDLCIKAGIVAPTAAPRNENQVFSIPLGYNKHLGITAVIDAGIGAYDWLTLGLHGRMITFTKKTQLVRLKTDTAQSGWIKLALGQATTQPGTIFEVGAYAKADHLVRGFSCTLGYSYVHKKQDTVTPCNTHLFAAATANSDAALQTWQMHTLHAIIEYDFAQENALFCPRISAFYDRQLSGQRTFKTSMGGAGIGLDLAW